MRHPAREFPYAELREGLAAAKAARLVTEQVSPDGLRLYCYSNSAVYDRVWTPFTLMARGLILDDARQIVAATPFPKFFNIGERDQIIPDLAFETFEKVDGSLIIIFWHAGSWRTATKGSLSSEQALWAQREIAPLDLSALTCGTTYLAEAIYPENRIVVHYEERGLVLLAAYDESGEELSYEAILDTAARLGWRAARRHSFGAISDLLAHTKQLPASEEGFVLRFSDGLRLKVKGEEYRRIHSLISRVTPLAMWEAMLAGDDMQTIRRGLPEEFWGDFDAIVTVLADQVASVVAETARHAEAVAALSDKDVGLRLNEFPPTVRPFIFPYRKQGGDLLTGRARQALFRALRPTGNQLAGYVPSYAINRVLDDAA